MRSTAFTTTSSTTPSSTGWSRRGSSSSTPSSTAGRSTARRAARSSGPSPRGVLAMLEIDLQGARQVRASRSRARCSPSSRPRPGTSWSAGWSAGAPRPRRNGSGACRPPGTSWRPRRSSMWSSSTTMFGERAKNSYHGCERVSALSDAAHRQPRAMHVETNPLTRRTPHVRNRGQPRSASPTRRSTTCSRPPTASTRWSSTRPSAPARSTRTTASSRRACSTTSARSWRPRSARSRCRSRCVRSTRVS